MTDMLRMFVGLSMSPRIWSMVQRIVSKEIKFSCTMIYALTYCEVAMIINDDQCIRNVDLSEYVHHRV